MPPANYNFEEETSNEKPNLCKRINECLFGHRERPVEVPLDDPGHTPINQIMKILVLGPGDSGKSTILKQMRVIHGANYTPDERNKYKPIIILNLVDSITRLIDAMQMFSIRFENEQNETDFIQIVNLLQHIKSGDLTDWLQNTSKYARIIRSIWDDPSIRTCYQRRNQFYLNDSTEYFIKNLPRISSNNYVPELDDVLRVRQPTTAIQEYKFKISGTYFLFVDVGGQRSERRKWINCFENVTSLLFVASLSDYDLQLSKDELRSSDAQEHDDTNRMRDALELFGTLINWKKKNYIQTKNTKNETVADIKETLFFEKASIILFLNKEDLFEEKFRRSSLKSCFADYVETDSSVQAKQFVASKFCERNKDKKNREIYWHYTFALDRTCIESVVASVKDRIFKLMFESMRL